MAYAIKSFSSLLTDMVAHMVANAPTITDLSPGSVIRSFCEASSLSIEELYVAVFLGFKRYLADIPENNFAYTRKSGTKASTTVVYSRTGAGAEVTIPAGTRLKTTSGLRFISEAGIIANGLNDSAAIAVEADEIGLEYNVLAATITTIEDVIDGAETVTNANAATGGVNVESDFEYTKRFQSYIEGLSKCNGAGLLEGALSVEGITSASLVEHFPVSGTKNASLYIDDGTSGGVDSDQVTAVQLVIDGDGTDENPGYRSAGVNVQVIAPTTVDIAVVATISPISGVDTDQMETDLNTAITGYINGLGVGGDVVYNEVIASIMGVYGSADCTALTLNAVSVNIAIAATQVGRVSTITLTIS